MFWRRCSAASCRGVRPAHTPCMSAAGYSSASLRHWVLTSQCLQICRACVMYVMSLYSLGNMRLVLPLQLAWVIHVGLGSIMFFFLWLVVGGFGGLWGLLCVCLFGFICLVCFDLFDFFDPGFGDGDAVGDVCVVDECYECDVGGCFVP